MTTQVDVDGAKKRLLDLLDRAAGGEDIVIAQPGCPRVRLVPIDEAREPHRSGRWKGRVWIGPDFDKDLTDQFEDL